MTLKPNHLDWDARIEFPALDNMTIKSEALSLNVFAGNADGIVAITLNGCADFSCIDMTPEQTLEVAAKLIAFAKVAASEAVEA